MSPTGGMLKAEGAAAIDWDHSRSFRVWGFGSGVVGFEDQAWGLRIRGFWFWVFGLGFGVLGRRI